MSATFGPVTKLQWLRAVAGRPDISRATLAACVLMADMAKADTGICWPSYNTISSVIGVSPRHTKKAVAAAIDAGLVTIAKPGTRTTSNRYRLNIGIIGSDLQDTTVVSSSAKGGDLQTSDVVIHRSPESIHTSEHQARMGGEISQAEGDALALRPGGPTLARHPRHEFDDFWKAVGRRATVAETEQRLAELVAAGVELGDIVAGADRWRTYNEATGGRRAVSPVKWLERQGWRDDWTAPAKRGQEEAKKKAPSSSSTGAKNAASSDTRKKQKRQKNPEYAKWEATLKTFTSVRPQATKHQENCPICWPALLNQEGDPCPTGRRLLDEAAVADQKAQAWRKQNPRPEPWI